MSDIIPLPRLTVFYFFSHFHLCLFCGKTVLPRGKCTENKEAASDRIKRGRKNAGIAAESAGSVWQADGEFSLKTCAGRESRSV